MDLETKKSSDGFSLTALLATYVAELRGGMTSLHNFLALHPYSAAQRELLLMAHCGRVSRAKRGAQSGSLDLAVGRMVEFRKPSPTPDALGSRVPTRIEDVKRNDRRPS